MSAAWCAASILALSLSATSGASAKARTPTRTSPKTPAACTNANLKPTSTNLTAIGLATLCLVNQVRAANHLRTVHLSSPLQSVATSQARDMVQGDYFGDNSLSGETPMQRILASPYRTHAKRLHTAQNIGWATGPLATPAGMVRAWMASPPHRAIILTSIFHDIGVGVTPAAPSSLSQGLAGATYTLELGRRILVARTATRTPRPR